METIGSVESVTISYDLSGRSKGKAEVIFRSRPDAERAVKEYDGHTIDEQPMKVYIIGRTKVGGSRFRSDSIISNRRNTRGIDRNRKNIRRPRPPRNNTDTDDSAKMMIDDNENFRVTVQF